MIAGNHKGLNPVLLQFREMTGHRNVIDQLAVFGQITRNNHEADVFLNDRIERRVENGLALAEQLRIPG